MRRTFGLILLTLFTAMAWGQTGLATSSGWFSGIGSGFAPLYIEEIIADDQLAAGATAISPTFSLRTGWVVQHYAIYLMTEQNIYVNEAQDTSTSGLTGLGISYLVPGLNDCYLSAGAGLASKTVIGDDAFASGTGLQLGVGRPLSQHFTLEMNYSYFSLDSVAVPFAVGERETITSLQFNLLFLWV